MGTVAASIGFVVFVALATARWHRARQDRQRLERIKAKVDDWSIHPSVAELERSTAVERGACQSAGHLACPLRVA
jgi:hypothetical protein